MYQETDAVRGGWAQPATDMPSSPDGLVSALQRIDALINHTYQISHGITERADHILGSRPEADSKQAPSPVRGGALGGLHDQIDRLETAMQRLDEQSRRFNAI